VKLNKLVCLAVGLELPLIVLIYSVTGWSPGLVALAVMIVGTPLLMGVAELMRRFLARKS